MVVCYGGIFHCQQAFLVRPYHGPIHPLLDPIRFVEIPQTSHPIFGLAARACSVKVPFLPSAVFPALTDITIFSAKILDLHHPHAGGYQQHDIQVSLVPPWQLDMNFPRKNGQ